MVSQRNRVIGGIIAIVVLVGGGVGIYFAVSGGKSDDSPKAQEEKSNDKLLIKSNDGTIKLYDRSVSNFVKVEADSKNYGIISFGQYLNETIYYATTELKSVIHSTNVKTYPDLPIFTAAWIKTAIDVDDLTKNVYVADREAKQIIVVNKEIQYVLPLTLNEPKDVILAPENGTMFILNQDTDRTEIIKADMDGTNQKSIFTHDKIQALAVDNENRILYFAHQGGIESFDYKDTGNKRLLLNKEIKTVQSLAYKNRLLYFVNKTGKSSKNPGTSLDVCDLTNSKCMNKCCGVQSIHINDQLAQVKIPKSEKLTAKNPCETNADQCEQFCLLNTRAEGRSCQCAVGWKLKPDNKTCEKNEVRSIGMKIQMPLN